MKKKALSIKRAKSERLKRIKIRKQNQEPRDGFGSLPDDLLPNDIEEDDGDYEPWHLADELSGPVAYGSFSEQPQKNLNVLPNKEFLDFAEYFSKSFRNLPCGEYFSKKKKYTIEYMEKFPSDPFTRAPITTDCRVGRPSGKIQIFKEKFSHDEYTEDYVFFILIWCYMTYESEQDNNRVLRANDPTLYADKLALCYYKMTGKPSKDVIKGMYRTMSYSANVNLFKQRLDQIFLILK